jgi:hypothetical protein
MCPRGSSVSMAAGCTGIIWPGDSVPHVATLKSRKEQGLLRAGGKCRFVPQPYLARAFCLAPSARGALLACSRRRTVKPANIESAKPNTTHPFGRARGPVPGRAHPQQPKAGRDNGPSLPHGRRTARHWAGRCGSGAAAFRSIARSDRSRLCSTPVAPPRCRPSQNCRRGDAPAPPRGRSRVRTGRR